MASRSASAPPSEHDVVVVGAGYSGLSAACYAARAGKKVLLLENLPTAGGRNQQFSIEGFTFERGPSWLWMKDVHEQFYRDMGRNMEDLSAPRVPPGHPSALVHNYRGTEVVQILRLWHFYVTSIDVTFMLCAFCCLLFAVCCGCVLFPVSCIL